MKCKMCDKETAGNSKYCPQHRDEARAAFREMIAAKKEEKEERERSYIDLFASAHAAGMLAVEKCVPTPMVVQQHANMLDDSSPIVKQWGPIMDGVCGFAWVNIRPGNSSFANWMKKNKGCHKAYEGGITYWIGDFNQSMEKKSAYARAFAMVLQKAGIKASSHERMD